MGSLLVYKCSTCGASKATNKLHFMIVCDYCGGMIGFDDFGFAKSEHYQKLLAKMQQEPVVPGTTPYRLSQLYYHTMETARVARNREAWLKAAEEYYRLYYPYYYGDFLREYMDDPMAQIEYIVKSILRWYDVSYFDSRMKKCWDKYERAWNEIQQASEKKAKNLAQRLVDLYTEVLKTLYSIISPSELGVICSSEKMVHASLVRWFQQLVMDQTLPQAMRDAMVATYKTMEQKLRDTPEQAVADRRGVIEMNCLDCGNTFTFTAKDGVYNCPQCGSSFRYLKNDATITSA